MTTTKGALAALRRLSEMTYPLSLRQITEIPEEIATVRTHLVAQAAGLAERRARELTAKEAERAAHFIERYGRLPADRPLAAKLRARADRVEEQGQPSATSVRDHWRVVLRGDTWWTVHSSGYASRGYATHGIAGVTLPAGTRVEFERSTDGGQTWEVQP